MASERKFLATREVWAKGLATVRATKRQTLLILVLGLILPQLLLSILIDCQSGAVVDGIRGVFTTRAASPGSLMGLIGPATGFLTELAVIIPLIFLSILASYFALVHIAVEHHRGSATPAAGRAWFLGLRSALPGGLVLTFALVCLVVMGQILIAPAIIMAVLTLVVPIIHVAERKGAFASLWRALSLKYVSRAEYTGWTVLFNLLTIGAILYTFLIATGFAPESLLFLDERLSLPRAIWTYTFSGLPFGPVYLLVSIFETTLTMTVLALFPAMTAALYFTVAGKKRLGEA